MKSGEEWSARAIGSKLGILPNTVYRAVRPLLASGLLSVRPGHPEVFRRVEEAQAVDNATAWVRSELLGDLGLVEAGSTTVPVANRDELLEIATSQMSRAQREVGFIVSGLEVPAETILAYKHAVDRGVQVRALVQEQTATSAQMYRNWQAIGVQVRHLGQYLPARLFVIDRQMCVYTSYERARGWEAVGQRIESRPLAAMLAELFEQQWRQSTEIGRPIGEGSKGALH